MRGRIGERAAPRAAQGPSSAPGPATTLATADKGA